MLNPNLYNTPPEPTLQYHSYPTSLYLTLQAPCPIQPHSILPHRTFVSIWPMNYSAYDQVFYTVSHVTPSLFKELGNFQNWTDLHITSNTVYSVGRVVHVPAWPECGVTNLVGFGGSWRAFMFYNYFVIDYYNIIIFIHLFVSVDLKKIVSRTISTVSLFICIYTNACSISNLL